MGDVCCSLATNLGAALRFMDTLLRFKGVWRREDEGERGGNEELVLRVGPGLLGPAVSLGVLVRGWGGLGRGVDGLLWRLFGVEGLLTYGNHIISTT